MTQPNGVQVPCQTSLSFDDVVQAAAVQGSGYFLHRSRAVVNLGHPKLAHPFSVPLRAQAAILAAAEKRYVELGGCHQRVHGARLLSFQDQLFQRPR
jgi:hypothetical protein